MREKEMELGGGGTVKERRELGRRGEVRDGGGGGFDQTNTPRKERYMEAGRARRDGRSQHPRDKVNNHLQQRGERDHQTVCGPPLNTKTPRNDKYREAGRAWGEGAGGGAGSAKNPRGLAEKKKSPRTEKYREWETGVGKNNAGG